MHEIGIKELKNSASRVIAEVEAGERVVVTKRGRPAAVIMSMEDVEDFVLAHAEEYVEMRLKARAAYSAGETVDLDDVCDARRASTSDSRRQWPRGEI